jgi:8-oxo-dGTP pyrophosphatase MutT (NUDIX family)
MGWTTIGSRLAYENPWIRVREDQVLRPDGSAGRYGVVEVRAPAVFVVPISDDDDVVLVSVDRYATGESSLEVPAGGAEESDLQLAAERELCEETGLVARHWRDLGRVQSLNGVAAAAGRVFLARGLREAARTAQPVDHQGIEGIDAVVRVPLDRLPDLLAAGGITDNESLGALLLALTALGRVR